MAKVLIGVDYGAYTFNAAGKTVTLTLPSGVTAKLESILLITNVTTNTIIYNFANPALGGSLSGNVLTLDYDTTSMASGDKLQFWYYNEVDQYVYDDNANASRLLLQNIVSNQTIPDNIGRTRVILEGTNNINQINTLTTCSSVTTVQTVTTLSNMGTYSASPMIPLINQIPIEIQLQKIIIT